MARPLAPGGADDAPGHLLARMERTYATSACEGFTKTLRHMPALVCCGTP
jgi:hypothetical protein